MVLSTQQFHQFIGVPRRNEIIHRDISPLQWCPNSPRDPTMAEVTAYHSMKENGPMFHGGHIPAQGDDNVRVAETRECQEISYTYVQYNNRHIECFVFGFKFFTIRDVKQFIQHYNIMTLRPKVASLLRGAPNKLNRRIKAQKYCLEGALVAFYNSRTSNSVTYNALRRRGLVMKIKL